MEDNIKAHGEIIKCMVEAFLYGLMVENTKVNTSMIKNKDMDSFAGLMVDLIKDSGKMENKTVREHIETSKGYRKMALG